MDHVYKPLPAVVGHHKVRPCPQCPQEFPVVTTAQTRALQQGQAHSSSQLVFSNCCQGEKGQAKDNTMELNKGSIPTSPSRLALR